MTTKRSLVVAVVVLALVSVFSTGAASAAVLSPATTAILSGDSSLFPPLPAPVATSETRDSTVSQDSRYVASESQADGLYDGDDDRVSNVYWPDSQSDPRARR